MAQHTPTPWRASWDYKMVGPDSRYVISHACGPQITSVGVPLEDGSEFLHPSKDASERMMADAEFIVLAVNVHDELVAAAELIMASAQSTSPEMTTAYAALKAALTKSKPTASKGE